MTRSSHSPICSCGQRLFDSSPHCTECRGLTAPAWLATGHDGTHTLVVAANRRVPISKSQTLAALEGHLRHAPVSRKVSRVVVEPSCLPSSLELRPLHGTVGLSVLLAALRGEFNETLYVR